MLYLYHGTTSVCAIKARLALHEKGLEWAGEILDLHRGDQRPAIHELQQILDPASAGMSAEALRPFHRTSETGH